MSFLSSILAFIIGILSFIPFFPYEWDPTGGGAYDGGGSSIGLFITESQASEAYRNGSWNGSKSGLYEVRDGLLYVGNKISSYPADSRVHYYRPPVVSAKGKYTVFLYDPGPGSGLLGLSWDYRGAELYHLNLSSYRMRSKTYSYNVSADGEEMIFEFTSESGGKETACIPVDYTSSDSSVSSYRPELVKIPGKYTVYLVDEYGYGLGTVGLYWDYKGKELHRLYIDDCLANSTGHSFYVSEDGKEIICAVNYQYTTELLHIPVDYKAPPPDPSQVASIPDKYDIYTVNYIEYSSGKPEKKVEILWVNDGDELHSLNLSEYCKYSIEQSFELFENGKEILCHITFRSGKKETLHVPVDYTG